MYLAFTRMPGEKLPKASQVYCCTRVTDIRKRSNDVHTHSKTLTERHIEYNNTKHNVQMHSVTLIHIMHTHYPRKNAYCHWSTLFIVLLIISAELYMVGY